MQITGKVPYRLKKAGIESPLPARQESGPFSLMPA